MEESPPSHPKLPGASSATEPSSGQDPRALFANLEGSNVGFKAFHPLPVSLINGSSNKLAGRAGLGGVWEWTSSVLERHEGFEAMALYPSYTGMPVILHPGVEHAHAAAADFFDGKHNIVLGGSWATHARIAGRKSLYVRGLGLCCERD